MGPESNHSSGIARVGIVVGGGPAPGINGTIGAVTLEAGNRGREVVGIYDGFFHLMAGRIDRVKHRPLVLKRRASTASKWCTI